MTDSLKRLRSIQNISAQYAAGSDLIRDAVDEIERLRADNAALSRRAEKAEKDVQWMVQKAADNDLAGYREMGSQLAAIETERDELRAEVERLRKRLEIIDGHEEFDGIACRDETIRQLESEVERLRGLVAHLEEQTDSQYDEAVTATDNEVDAIDDDWLLEEWVREMSEPDWRTHDIYDPPADLAPAQIVRYIFFRDGGMGKYDKEEFTNRVDRVAWWSGLRYRPVLSASGLPLCSAEGLEPWARYVARDADGMVWQHKHSPSRTDTAWYGAGWVHAIAPRTHAKPGDWRESLMEVAR